MGGGIKQEISLKNAPTMKPWQCNTLNLKTMIMCIFFSSKTYWWLIYCDSDYLDLIHEMVIVNNMSVISFYPELFLSVIKLIQSP